MLEICVEDIAGIEAAIGGGADRLEVCSALALGGLTPSPALVACAVRRGVPVRALIRPRPGGFHYGEAELDLMEADIAAVIDAGAQGVVLGAADANGELDETVMNRLIEAARRRGGRGVGLTLHRVIDLTTDPVATVTQAGTLGFDCVLSSGGAARALDGATTLARMVLAAPRGLTIMAGAGVTPQSAPDLILRSGIRSLHASARGQPLPTSSSLVALGFAGPETSATSPEIVAQLKTILTEQTHSSSPPLSRSRTHRRYP